MKVWSQPWISYTLNRGSWGMIPFLAKQRKFRKTIEIGPFCWLSVKTSSIFRLSQSMVPFLRRHFDIPKAWFPCWGLRWEPCFWFPQSAHVRIIKTAESLHFPDFFSQKSSTFQLSQSMIPLSRVMKGIMLLISHNQCMSEASEPLNPCILTDFFSQNHQYFDFHKAWFLFRGS